MDELEDKYQAGQISRCPHCGDRTRFLQIERQGNFNRDFDGLHLVTQSEELWLRASQCTLCSRMVVWYEVTDRKSKQITKSRAWPIGAERPVLALVREKREQIVDTYKRASRLLGYDNTASAAFARTCLEKVLDEQGIPKKRETKKGKQLDLTLHERIKAFQEAKNLTPDLNENLDMLREMGNFIHLNESFATGQIVEVEEAEAEWALDILRDLFDELYTKPAMQDERRKMFTQKLNDVGKQLGTLRQDIEYS